MGSNRLLPPNVNEEAHSPDYCWQTYRQHEGDQSDSKADTRQKAETITGKLRQILYQTMPEAWPGSGVDSDMTNKFPVLFKPVRLEFSVICNH